MRHCRSQNVLVYSPCGLELCYSSSPRPPPPRRLLENRICFAFRPVFPAASAGEAGRAAPRGCSQGLICGARCVSGGALWPRGNNVAGPGLRGEEPRVFWAGECECACAEWASRLLFSWTSQEGTGWHPHRGAGPVPSPPPPPVAKRAAATPAAWSGLPVAVSGVDRMAIPSGGGICGFG